MSNWVMAIPVATDYAVAYQPKLETIHQMFLDLPLEIKEVLENV